MGWRQKRIDDWHRKRPELGGGEDRDNTRERESFVCIDSQQSAPPMLTPHERDMKRSFDLDIGGKPTSSGQESLVFTAERFKR